MGGALRESTDSDRGAPPVTKDLGIAKRKRTRPPLSPPRKRVKGWLDQLEWPLAAIALLFLAAYAWPILEPTLGHHWKQLCSAVVFGTWIVFIADYLTRLWVSRDRRSYFLKHLLDLIIVALPVLRPMRLLRLVVLFRILNRKAASALQGRVPLYVSLSALTLVFCAALAVLDAERHAPASSHANITSFGNAIWWAVTTVTTVGYGDHYPVTVEGRFVAAGLMIGGVALIGVVTASFAAWFIDRVRADEEDQEEAMQRDMATVVAQLGELTAEVKRLRAAAERQETPAPR